MDFLLNLLSGVQVIGHWGYLVAFLFAFLESLAMVGGFIPGSTAIVFLGFMCSQGYLNINLLLLVVVIGAILGDTISYWLGTKGTNYFKDENKILKTQHLLSARKFFEKHGSKSIFLGRFIGVIRSLIPFSAGLAKMNFKIFLFWTIFSAGTWGAVHVYLGYFFGNALGLIRMWTHKIGIISLILIIAVAVAWYLLKQAKPTAHTIVRVLSLDKKYVNNRPYGWPLVTLGFMISIAIIVLALLADNFLDSNALNYFDDLVSNFFYFIRDPLWVNIFVWISLLCKAEVVIALSILTIFGLYLYNKKYIIIPFIMSVGGSAVIGWLIKILIDRPRPMAFPPVYFEPSWSFPSGHSLLAVTLYGFLIYYFLRFKSHTKSLLYNAVVIVAGLIIILSIGFSRVYLGVHYFSDVVGGYIIGFLVLALVIVVNEWFIYRGQDKKINEFLPDIFLFSERTKKYLPMILFSIFVIFFIVYGMFFYHPIYIFDPGMITINR